MNRPGISFETVTNFYQHGFSVIPMRLGTKFPQIKWRRYQKTLPTLTQLEVWFASPCNGGVITGSNNLVVIDFDTLADYTEWQLWCLSEGSTVARLILRDAYRVRTRRGVHVYVRAKKAKICNGHYDSVDVKGWGGLVILPGSVHPSGYVYQEMAGYDFVFPLFEKLEDILPDSILSRKVEVADTFIKVRRDTMFDDISAFDILDVPVGSGDLNTIKAIKDRYRIEDFITGITMTGEHWYVAKCPFHDDNNPSFWVDTERQLCGCFSGCTAVPLDVIDLYARLHGLSNSEAIRVMSRE